MNRPSPSLAILAIIAVTLALIFLWRKYESPHQSADAMSRAAVAGYRRPIAIEAPGEDDAATMAGMMDAGRVWAQAHRPNSAAGCPSLPAPFHAGCAAYVSSDRR